MQFVRLSGGSEEEAAELELAAGEALTNAYRHAYRNTHGPVRLELSHDDRKIQIDIHDEGDVVAGELKIPSTVLQAGEHCGLFLIGQLTDHAEIVHPRNERGGTTVRMVKHVNKVLQLANMLGRDRRALPKSVGLPRVGEMKRRVAGSLRRPVW